DWLKGKGPQQIPLCGPVTGQKPRLNRSKRKPRGRKNKRKQHAQKRSYTNRSLNELTKHFSSNWARRHTRHPIPTRRTHDAFHRPLSTRRRSQPAIGKLEGLRLSAIQVNLRRVL